MDQIKIGRFIALKRKDQNLTQANLAEMLNITDRAVSKWERGISLPDSSIMLELCKILKITVNELLSGEELKMENYNETLEKISLDLIKQKEEADKKLLMLENVIGVLSIIILLSFTMVAAYLDMASYLRVILIVMGFVISIAGLLIALRIEQTAGYYECSICKHKYVPSYSRIFLSIHIGKTRYLKCPNCHKRSWNKKVVRKSE